MQFSTILQTVLLLGAAPALVHSANCNPGANNWGVSTSQYQQAASAICSGGTDVETFFGSVGGGTGRYVKSWFNGSKGSRSQCWVSFPRSNSLPAFSISILKEKKKKQAKNQKTNPQSLERIQQHHQPMHPTAEPRRRLVGLVLQRRRAALRSAVVLPKNVDPLCLYCRQTKRGGRGNCIQARSLVLHGIFDPRVFKSSVFESDIYIETDSPKI